jgi:hypothetical protein
MCLVRKLKPDRNITGALVSLSILPVFGLTSLIFSINIGMYTLAAMICMFSVFYLYSFIRTGNSAQLVPAAEGVFLTYIFIVIAGNRASNIFDRIEFAFALQRYRFLWRFDHIFGINAQGEVARA